MSKLSLKCDLEDVQVSQIENKQLITFKLRHQDLRLLESLKELQSDKGLRVDVDVWREKRSLDANAYFHLLVNEIARKMNISDTECKIKMNLEYGTPATDKEGNKVYAKLPKSVDVNDFYQYAKWIKNKTEDGFETSYYLFYKHTHTLDTKEMASLIDGVVSEAKKYGIETRTPDEIAKMLSLMEKK